METVRIGARVEVKRVNLETRVGYVLERVESLRHIGEFYNVGDLLEETPRKTQEGRGRPRKGQKPPEKKLRGVVWGMYAPEDMRVLPGRTRKEAEHAQVGA